MTDVMTRPVAPEIVTPLRPSEAMRLGRMLYPVSCFGYLATDTRDGVAVCARGAMWAGYGWTPVSGEIDGAFVDADGKRGLYKSATCPACALRSTLEHLIVRSTIEHLIEHLNDRPHCWSTERIADWLAEQGL